MRLNVCSVKNATTVFRVNRNVLEIHTANQLICGSNISFEFLFWQVGMAI